MTQRMTKKVTQTIRIYPQAYEEYGVYGDGPNMERYEGKSFEHFADEWEITKRSIAGKIRRLNKDELWDAVHALQDEWVPTDIDTLEAFKTRTLDRFGMTHMDVPGRFLGNSNNGGNIQRYIAFENINQLVYRAHYLEALYGHPDPGTRRNRRSLSNCKGLPSASSASFTHGRRLRGV